MSGHDPVKEYARVAIRKKQEEAEARVEEAAPDLLAALKNVLSPFERDAGPDDPIDQIIISEARAAIAKAEGEGK